MHASRLTSPTTPASSLVRPESDAHATPHAPLALPPPPTLCPPSGNPDAVTSPLQLSSDSDPDLALPCPALAVAGNPSSVDLAARAIEDIVNGGNGFRIFQQAGPNAFGGYGGYGVQGGQRPYNAGGYGAGGYGGYQGGYQGGAAPQKGGYGGYGGYDYAGGYGQQASYGSAAGGYQQGSNYQQGGAVANMGANSVWQAVVDDQGRTYYYNSISGQSQWEKPPGFA